MKKELLRDFLLPLLILFSLTMVFWFTNVDIALEELFYSSNEGWFLKKANPWNFLYHYGNIPAFSILLIATVVFAAGFVYRRMLRYRKIGLFLILVMLLGPGLIVNTIFKEHWGRPRPRQIENFGGDQKFLRAWQKGTFTKGDSFPSGHASVGFYLFSPFFFLRRHAKRWAVFFLLFGISYGALMGFGRMVQGGHFASDVLWAGGFTYLTGLILHYLFGFNKEIWWKPGAPGSERLIA